MYQMDHELTVEWLEQLNELIDQVEEQDSGNLTSVLDLLSQSRDELETVTQ